MRRTAFLLTCLLLTACGGGGSADLCAKEYWDDRIGVCLPSGWIVLDSETLRQRGAPDDTIVAFQTEESVSGQFPTVTVTFEPLADATDSASYSEASVRAVAALPGYELVDSVPTSVDEDEVTLHMFDAQPIADEPLRRFYQISAVGPDGGYSVTGSTPVSIEDDLQQQVLAILQSTTFIDKNADE